MRQKTKNHQNQWSIDKKFDFFPQSLSHIPRWVHLVQKTQAKNSHAWAPLRNVHFFMFPLVWGQVGLALRDRNSYSASGSEFTDPIESGPSPYPENGGIDIFKPEIRGLGGARGGSAGHDVWRLGALP